MQGCGVDKFSATPTPSPNPTWEYWLWLRLRLRLHFNSVLTTGTRSKWWHHFPSFRFILSFGLQQQYNTRMRARYIRFSWPCLLRDSTERSRLQGRLNFIDETIALFLKLQLIFFTNRILLPNDAATSSTLLMLFYSIATRVSMIRGGWAFVSLKYCLFTRRSTRFRTRVSVAKILPTPDQGRKLDSERLQFQFWLRFRSADCMGKFVPVLKLEIQGRQIRAGVREKSCINVFTCVLKRSRIKGH